MASFTSLPNELKLSIITYVDHWDLRRLSRVCRTLRSVAFPELLRNISFLWVSDDPAFPVPGLTALLRTILESPSLAKHVRSVEMRARNCRPRPFRGQGRKYPVNGRRITDSEMVLCDKALEVLELSEMEQWKKALRENILNAIVALFLSQCTHLESLIVDVEMLLENPWLPAMVKNALTPRISCQRISPFNHLYSIAVKRAIWWDVELIRSTNFLFLYIPKLVQLDLVMSYNPDYDKKLRYAGCVWPLAEPPVAKDLRQLRFLQSSNIEPTTEFILRQTPNLAELQVDVELPSSERPLSCTCLWNAIRHVHDKLETLGVRVELYPNEVLDVERLKSVCDASLGPLREFSALTTLETSLGVLLGQAQNYDDVPLADMLPPNLETLTINNDLWGYDAFPWVGDERTLAVFKRFLTGEVMVMDSSDSDQTKLSATWLPGEPAWKYATPNLKQFNLHLRRHKMHQEHRGVSFWGDDMIEEMGIACKSQGLRFSIVKE